MAETLKDLKVKISLDNSKFTTGIKNVERECSSLTETVKKVGVAIAGAFVVKKAIEFATAVGKVGIEYNALQEQSKVTWTTLLGDQQQAIDQLEKIEKFAAETPFTKMGVDTMAKYLHNAGYEGDEVFKTLSKIGDMGSAFGIQEDSLVEMTRQFSQVQQAGYAYTEDLNILADRGVPIYKAIAEEVGCTVAEVKKMASEGKLTTDIYNAAIDSMAEANAGAMDAQSKTFNGMISTLEDNLTALAGLITQDLFNALKGALEIVLPLVESFVQAYKETGTLSGAFQGILPVLEDFGVNVGLIKEAWSMFSDFLSETYNTMIAPVIDGFRELTQDMTEKFAENSGSIQSAFENVGSVLSSVWYDVIQPVWDLFIDYIFDLWDFFNENIGNVASLWETVSDILKTIWESVLKPVFEQVMKWVKQTRDKFGEYMPEIQRVVDEVFETIKKCWETSLKPAFEAIGKFLKNVLLPIFSVIFTYGILPIVETVFQTMIKLWDRSLKPALEGITEFLGGIFTLNWTKAWNGLSKIFGSIWGGLRTVAQAPLNAIINMINTVIGGLNKIKLPDWVPGIGGKGINIPKIPTLWKGSEYTLGGLTLVGEQGPELVNMPRGASVTPAHETEQMLKNANGATEIVLKIENFYNNTANDIENIADELAYLIRRKRISLGGV